MTSHDFVFLNFAHLNTIDQNIQFIKSIIFIRKHHEICLANIKAKIGMTKTNTLFLWLS